MPNQPPEVFDGWRLDIEPIWEAYNRIFFSYKLSEIERELYLRRLYRSHFVVFAYSFMDAITSKILLENLSVSRSQLKKFRHLRSKVEHLHKHENKIATLDAYDNFWRDIEWLRNELIHPKRTDHLSAIELDKLDLADRVRRLNLFAVRVHQVAKLEFPYWLTGWNFVNSMTSTSDFPRDGISRTNNAQFKVFLQMYGWVDPHYRFQALEVVENYLIGENIYNHVMEFLDGLDFDTQPLPHEIGYSLMPLWSRRWWDRQAIENLRAFRRNNSPFKDKTDT